jgi:hypothetical protein
VNTRIQELAENALAATNNDVAAAVRLLAEWTGLSFERALMAIEEIARLEEPEDYDDPIEDEPL